MTVGTSIYIFNTGPIGRVECPDKDPLQSTFRWTMGWTWGRLYGVFTEGSDIRPQQQWSSGV